MEWGTSSLSNFRSLTPSQPPRLWIRSSKSKHERVREKSRMHSVAQLDGVFLGLGSSNIIFYL